MSRDELVILPDDQQAAELKTVQGWVSRDGFFYGASEELARWAGSTHRKCECGTVVRKHLTRCPACQEKVEQERYNAMEKRPWDGEQMIYSQRLDEYFSDPSSAFERVVETDLCTETMAWLQLILCEPTKVRELDEDFFEDTASEDGELPDDLVDAINNFNAAVRDHGPMSWVPGKYALLIEESQHAE